jgi:AraC-like DNA-binding protein
MGAQMQPSRVSKKAVGRVIQAMHENLSEQLTLDEMARTAMFSKFHFTRMFQRVTGISPGRFLAAVRLEEAKQLLTTTSLSVTEITHRVGYSSVGTFSSRFSSSVGVSPRTYRRSGGVPPSMAAGEQQVSALEQRATVHGEVYAASDDSPGPIFVGLFPGPVHEGRPASGVVLAGPGPYTLENVPPGRWYLLAHSRTAGRENAHWTSNHPDSIASLGSHGPITITAGAVVQVDVVLRLMDVFDPPVLLALRI